MVDQAIDDCTITVAFVLVRGLSPHRKRIKQHNILFSPTPDVSLDVCLTIEFVRLFLFRQDAPLLMRLRSRSTENAPKDLARFWHPFVEFQLVRAALDVGQRNSIDEC